jgi:predicted nucleotide-binding protein (sugar kinase/HSP70/actin superfamily)
VQAHVHQLLFHKHRPDRRAPLHYIFFPILTHLPSFVADTVDNTSCPIVAGTPDVVKAAFTKEADFFAQRGIEYLAPALTFAEPTFLARRMFEAWGGRLGVTEDESDHACREGWKALAAFDQDLQEKGRAILETVEAEDRVAILLLGRPYHSDPGLNHGIPEEFQARGYPILSIRSIPKDPAYLDRYYRDELERGAIATPLQLGHIWPENYSANSAQKVWGANFAAHHPNVAVLDLSSFKCGHDAPTYGMIDSVLQTAKTPSAALHDLDANKPGGSILIRVKTYTHSLRLHQERLEELAGKRRELEKAVHEKRLALAGLQESQRASRRRRAAQVADEVDAFAASMRAYRGALPPPLPRPGPGLLQLQRRQADGSLGPIPLRKEVQ